jgi:O-antigen/teichoic acid export membrane protein
MREIGLTVNRALEKMERDMVVKTVTNALILGLGILLLKIEVSPKSVALAYAIGSAVGFATIAFMIRKHIKEFLGVGDIKLVGSIIKTAWPFVFIIFLGAIMGNTDTYMLGIWKDPAEIGLYASIQRMQNFIVLIPSTIAVATFPLMSRLIVADKTQSRMVLEKTLALIMLIGLPIALGGVILADQIIPFIFGQGYLGAIPVMQVLMLMMLASFPLFLLSNAIFTHNRQKELVPAYMFGILINILLNFLLIPQFGAVGASVATLASTAGITAIILKKLKTISYFEIMPKLKIAFFATLLMTLATLTLKHFGINFVVNIGISSIIYFSALFLLKEPTIGELKEFISNVGREK